MPYVPNTFSPSRKFRTFQTLSPTNTISPFYFMIAATTGVAGHALKYSTTDETVVQIATSGLLTYQFAGFLTQDVKDLDGQGVRGYRNLNSFTANLGDSVGVAQSNGLYETAQYNGTPTLGQRLCVNDSTGNLTVYSALMTGDPLAVVEATVGSVPTRLEPQQFSSANTGNNLIRIRVYAF